MLPLAATLGMSAALSAPTLARAHVGAVVVNARTGSVLFSRGAGDAFAPASTMKLLVGSAVLSLLGPDAVVQTTVAADGTLESGTLHGNLYVRGGGDPTIDGAAFDDAARAIAAEGVARVDGAVVVDDSAFTAPPYPDGWTIDDLPNDYAAPITALAFDENAVTLRVSPAQTQGAPATIALRPQSAAVSIDNRSTTGARGSADSTQLAWPANSAGTIELTGSVPMAAGDPTELGAAVRDPAAFAGDAFVRALAAANVQVLATATRAGTTPADARVLWRRSSPPMRELVARMWLPSDNFFAETLLEDLASGDASQDTRASGIARETAWLKSIGIDPAAMTVADGSGVSQYDRITPEALVSILLADWNGPNRAAVLAALPVAGRSGTLERAFAGTPLEGIVHAKTGTMMHTRTLAGYVVPAQGDPLVFALLLNDWMDGSPGAPEAMRAVQERFLEAARSGVP